MNPSLVVASDTLRWTTSSIAGCNAVSTGAFRIGVWLAVVVSRIDGHTRLNVSGPQYSPAILHIVTKMERWRVAERHWPLLGKHAASIHAIVQPNVGIMPR
ncbi:protein of unknown function [Burkholderia multivorans]